MWEEAKEAPRTAHIQLINADEDMWTEAKELLLKAKLLENLTELHTIIKDLSQISHVSVTKKVGSA